MLNLFKKIYKKYKELINYIFFGGLTTIISLIIYYLLVLTLLNPNNTFELQIANILSWIGGVTFAYVTNRKYVFDSKNNKKKEASKFVLSRITTLVMDMLIMFIFVSIFHFNDKIIKIIYQIIIIISNYLLSKYIVFKKDNN